MPERAFVSFRLVRQYDQPIYSLAKGEIDG